MTELVAALVARVEDAAVARERTKPRRSSWSSSASAAGVRRPRSGLCRRSRYPSDSTRPGLSCRPARTTRRSTRSSCRSPRPSTGRWPAVAVRTLHADRRRRPGLRRPLLQEHTRAGSWGTTQCWTKTSETGDGHTMPLSRRASTGSLIAGASTRFVSSAAHDAALSPQTPAPGAAPRRGCRAIRRGAPRKARTPLRRGRVSARRDARRPGLSTGCA